jgi:hypothetical protein
MMTITYHVGKNNGGYRYGLGDVWSETSPTMLPPLLQESPLLNESMSRAMTPRSPLSAFRW